MEAIYEPVFDSLKFQNYGLTPKKSQKKRIFNFYNEMTACNYALQGEIVSAYKNVNLKILMKILGNKITDQRFLAFIRPGCYGGFIDFGKSQDPLIGVPQSNIASPLFFNIYMHEFDCLINYQLQEYINDYNA